MTEIIKKDTDYAMRMLAYLARNNGKSPIAAKKLATAGEVPEDFAYKILRKLTRAGLAVGSMGSHGGFKLAKAPQDITLFDVVSAIQGPITVRKCCLANEACSRQGICDISTVLGGLQANLTGSLQKITVADILKETQYKQ
jgi:Rrf2 family protein